MCEMSSTVCCLLVRGQKSRKLWMSTLSSFSSSSCMSVMWSSSSSSVVSCMSDTVLPSLSRRHRIRATSLTTQEKTRKCTHGPLWTNTLMNCLDVWFFTNNSRHLRRLIVKKKLLFHNLHYTQKFRIKYSKRKICMRALPYAIKA